MLRPIASMLAGGLMLAALGAQSPEPPRTPPKPPPAEAKPTDAVDREAGRPVRVVSIGFRGGGKALPQIRDLVDAEGARGADLIALPETWRGQKMETLDGLAVQAMRSLARKHKTYIVCPIYRDSEGRRFNSAVLIDRAGKVVCIYDKAYPYWSEFPLKPTTQVGRDVPVHQADFGRVGMAICFDANFPEVWRRLAEKGAELVIWSSAYSAGRQLQAHALNHHYYIVTSTFTRDCQVYDITGERILDERRGDPSVARITLDLDRGIYHENFNRGRLGLLQKEHPGEVKVDKRLPREQWFVLKAAKAGVGARALAKQYGLEELRAYKTRSRRQIDKMRGGPLPKAK